MMRLIRAIAIYELRYIKDVSGIMTAETIGLVGAELLEKREGTSEPWPSNDKWSACKGDYSEVYVAE